MVGTENRVRELECEHAGRVGIDLDNGKFGLIVSRMVRKKAEKGNPTKSETCFSRPHVTGWVLTTFSQPRLSGF